jgi:hypothetical protein
MTASELGELKLRQEAPGGEVLPRWDGGLLLALQALESVLSFGGIVSGGNDVQIQAVFSRRLRQLIVFFQGFGQTEGSHRIVRLGAQGAAKP